MAQNVVVIGSGFAGLSAAAALASKGYKVKLLEKNDCPGGRARSFFVDGYRFDMGPSWYWMPDVFEEFFQNFGKKVEDFYNLQRLNPSYRVHFSNNDVVDLPASMTGLEQLFESLERGGSENLRLFLKEAEYKYNKGMKDLVYRPGRSLKEFADTALLSATFRLQVFQSMSSHIRKYFQDPRLIQIMEFPVLFLGGTPKNTPALYSLMNYADMALGTWYPEGGMHRIVEAMVELCLELDVELITGAEVEKIEVTGKHASKVHTTTHSYSADVIVAAADYHHVETSLLEKEHRSYSTSYWESRKLAPSALIFYLGVSKKIKNLLHHNLFFDEDFNRHACEIYNRPQWPHKPLFYVSAPSKTDPTVAPEGCENLFILMPVAPGIQDDAQISERYYNLLMDRLEAITGETIKNSVTFKRAYSHSNFIHDYHSFKGNAYGLANTLNQTAILKPSCKSRKLENLYFAGQLTVPGPGVPPALISGQVVAAEITREHPLSVSTNHETTV